MATTDKGEREAVLMRLRKERRLNPQPLTPRQHEVAKLAARGYTNKQIAEQTNLSPNTTANYLGYIYIKLGVANRAELADIPHLREEGPTPDLAQDQVTAIARGDSSAQTQTLAQ